MWMVSSVASYVGESMNISTLTVEATIIAAGFIFTALGLLFIWQWWCGYE